MSLYTYSYEEKVIIYNLTIKMSPQMTEHVAPVSSDVLDLKRLRVKMCNNNRYHMQIWPHIVLKISIYFKQTTYRS
jgi:hypothetical protein